LSWIIKAAREFGRAQGGASYGEYGILLALVAVVCFSAMAAVGGKINAFFAAFSSTL
jgi:Flp pilus assembly pilin Flp